MTVNSKIFSISTLNTIEHGPLTLNIKPHLDPPLLYQKQQDFYSNVPLTHE